MSFADRVDRDVERYEAGLWDAHERGAHDGEDRQEDCPRCARALREAHAEHAWMAQAVKTNPTNPYAPADPEAPEDDWYEDEEGFVKAPLSYENREGDPAFNGAFNVW